MISINTSRNICQICHNMSWIIFVRQTTWYCVCIIYDSLMICVPSYIYVIVNTFHDICMSVKSGLLIFFAIYSPESYCFVLISSLIYSSMQMHRLWRSASNFQPRTGRYLALTEFDRFWIHLILRWLEVNMLMNHVIFHLYM